MSLRPFARKGDTCSFTVTVLSGIAARYTQARLQVRAETDERVLPVLLEAEVGDGLTITHGTPGVVAVSIGASKTEELPAFGTKMAAFAQLRFYDPENVDDRWSVMLPFDLLPETIDD